MVDNWEGGVSIYIYILYILGALGLWCLWNTISLVCLAVARAQNCLEGSEDGKPCSCHCGFAEAP